VTHALLQLVTNLLFFDLLVRRISPFANAILRTKYTRVLLGRRRNVGQNHWHPLKPLSTELFKSLSKVLKTKIRLG